MENLKHVPLDVSRFMSGLPVYNAGRTLADARRRSGLTDIARLASNENPDGCSPRVPSALAGLEHGRYSDPDCSVLRAALGASLSVAQDRIVVGNGSEDLLGAICRALLNPEDEVITVAPSFGLHEIGPRSVGARVVKLSATPDWSFPIESLETALQAAPRMVVISSPWNPVGPALTRAHLRRLFQAMRPNTVFVLDEAYAEYVDDPDVPDGMQAMLDCPVHHVVLRTFSKAYGLAGLRVGYGVCSTAGLADSLRRACTPFNVNAVAQAAAVAALQDRSWMVRSVTKCVQERRRVESRLRDLGFVPARSQGNFLFFDSGLDSSLLTDALLANGVIVKPWREEGYNTCLRVTIGSREENDRFLQHLTMLADKF